MDSPKRNNRRRNSPFRSLTNAFFFFGLALYLDVYVTLTLHITGEDVDRDEAAVLIDRSRNNFQRRKDILVASVRSSPSLLLANPPGALKIQTDHDDNDHVTNSKSKDYYKYNNDTPSLAIISTCLPGDRFPSSEMEKSETFHFE
jgi:hypothetical protein